MYSNDTKPSGNYSNETMPFFVSTGTLMFTVPLITYSANVIGQSYSNDSEPTAISYSNDNKP